MLKLIRSNICGFFFTLYTQQRPRLLGFCMVGHVLKTFFKRNEIRDGIENGLNLVQDTCIGLLLQNRIWTQEKQQYILPLNSVFKISDIVKYNFFPTCSNHIQQLVVDRKPNSRPNSRPNIRQIGQIFGRLAEQSTNLEILVNFANQYFCSISQAGRRYALI